MCAHTRMRTHTHMHTCMHAQHRPCDLTSSYSSHFLKVLHPQRALQAQDQALGSWTLAATLDPSHSRPKVNRSAHREASIRRISPSSLGRTVSVRDETTHTGWAQGRTQKTKQTMRRGTALVRSMKGNSGKRQA